MLVVKGVVGTAGTQLKRVFYYAVVWFLETVYYEVTVQGIEDRPKDDWVLRVGI